jgi:thiol-disulfide isomerase/thioredoxin
MPISKWLFSCRLNESPESEEQKMKAMQRKIVFIAAIIPLIPLLSCGKEKKGLKRPYEVSNAVFDSVMTLIRQGKVSSRDQFVEARNNITVGVIDEVDTDSLGRADSLLYGKLLFWSGRNGKARNIFDNLSRGKDEESRGALLELATMEIEKGNESRAEALLAQLRAAFPPSPEYKEALYEQCEDLGGRYNDMNRIEDAIRVYQDELKSLPFDAPYKSFMLLAELASVCQEAGRIDECKDLLLGFKNGLEKGLEDYLDRVTYSDSTEESDDPIPSEYRRYTRSCDLLIDRMELIGKPAPPLSFMHVYGTDSSLTLESLKGKVVVLDFWATWCVPCIISFSEMKELYKEFKDQGLEIVGITSLQTFFSDMETGHTERNIGPRREIEITAEYIEKKGITWPCAISENSVFDPAYTVEVIPTFVVLDHNGRVRFIQSFAGQIGQKRRIIERLLREKA